MTELVTIIEEPTRDTYVALLQFAMRLRSQFSLVWRDQLDYSPSAAMVAEALQPELLSERRTAEWPGTQLSENLATVRLYRMSPRAVATLVEASGLYDWCGPERPEDLTFYTVEGRPWLGSIAHERDAFVYAQAVDLQELMTSVKGLKLEGITGE